MELGEIIEYLGSLPAYAWVIVAVVLLFILGDRKKWEYEVKFPLNASVGRGEIEVTGYQKKGPVIEAKLRLERAYNDKDVQVFVGGVLALTVPAGKNKGPFFIYREKYKSREPKEGDTVEVMIDNRKVFSGVLVMD